MKADILFLWKPEDNLMNHIRSYIKREGISLSYDDNISFSYIDENSSEEEKRRLYVEANIIVGWNPDETLIKAAENLELFINPGAGVKHLIKLFRDLNETREVILVNGHGNSYFTAQHAVALLLALTNKIVPHHNWMMEGKWRLGDKEAASIPLRNRKVGLLGYGAINSKVHNFLSGFGLEFRALKTRWGDEKSWLHIGIEKYIPSQLYDFLSKVDILFVALPDTEETNGLLKAEELSLLGSSALIVNIARGGIIDEESFYNALKNKTIAGAAIDVWYDYSPEEASDGKKFPFHFPFNKLDNVILSPHRAASPFDDLHRWDEVAENIIRFIEERDDFLNIVDLEKGY